MKRFVFAGALALAAGGQALAADLPPPMAPPPRAPATYVPAPVPIFTWIGPLYRYQWRLRLWHRDSLRRRWQHKPQWLSGRRHARRQLSVRHFVVGLEGDGDWSNLDGTSGGAEVKSTWLATVRGRAGYAWDRVLLYGTAGGAFGNEQAGPTGGPFTSGYASGLDRGRRHRGGLRAELDRQGRIPLCRLCRPERTGAAARQP